MTPTDHPLEEWLPAYDAPDEPPSNPRLTKIVLICVAVELAVGAVAVAVWLLLR